MYKLAVNGSVVSKKLLTTEGDPLTDTNQSLNMYLIMGQLVKVPSTPTLRFICCGRWPALWMEFGAVRLVDKNYPAHLNY